jgi:glycosyltransferase involved in cell wall biosynthesis
VSSAASETQQLVGSSFSNEPIVSVIRRVSSLQVGEGWFSERGGGLNRYYAELVKRLPAAGVDCRGLLVGSDALAAMSGNIARAVAPSDASMRSRWRGMRTAVAEELARAPVDLVVAHFAPYAWPILRTLGSTPLVVHFHGPWAAESRAEGAGRIATWMKWRMERAVYQRARSCIVLSHAFKKLLAEDYGIPADRIRVINGGVDLGRFNTSLSRPDARQKLGWPVDRPIILCVRRLVRRMGLENLIAAAAQIRAAFPTALTIIGGTGPLADELKQQIAAASVGESVRLVGFISDNDLPLAFRAADLTIIPSISLEGFGLVAAESLAAGTPALVTSVGGLPEVIAPLSQALILPAGGAPQLTAFLSDVLSGRRRLPAAEECRRYAERFDWNSVTRDIATVYGESV